MPVVPVKPEYVSKALTYAACSLDWTFDRMSAGVSDIAIQKRFLRIRDGLVVHHAVVDYLPSVGLAVDTSRVTTNWRSRDFGDLSLGDEAVDIKGLRLPEGLATQSEQGHLHLCLLRLG